MPERVRHCREEYAHFAVDPKAMVGKLGALKQVVGGEEMARWHALTDAGAVDELFERLMTAHYDPCYSRSTTREFGPGDGANRLELDSLRPDALAVAASRLIDLEPTGESVR